MPRRKISQREARAALHELKKLRSYVCEELCSPASFDASALQHVCSFALNDYTRGLVAGLRKGRGVVLAANMSPDGILSVIAYGMPDGVI